MNKRNHGVATVMGLALFLTSFAGPVFSQTVAGPESVQNGEMIHYTFDGFQTGDEIQWTLLNPYPEPAVKTVSSAFATSFVVDPPINWSGMIRVQCLVTDSEKRLKHFATTETTVEAGAAPGPPQPEPGPDPPPPAAEYDGPNELGLGQLSFDNAPEYNADLVNTLRQAQLYLYGKGGPNGNEFKPMAVQATDSRNGTTAVLPVWLAKQGRPASFADWDKNAYAKAYQMNLQGNQWYQAFDELAAGIEARK